MTIRNLLHLHLAMFKDRGDLFCCQQKICLRLGLGGLSLRLSASASSGVMFQSPVVMVLGQGSFAFFEAQAWLWQANFYWHRLAFGEWKSNIHIVQLQSKESSQPCKVYFRAFKCLPPHRQPARHSYQKWINLKTCRTIIHIYAPLLNALEVQHTNQSYARTAHRKHIHFPSMPLGPWTR